MPREIPRTAGCPPRQPLSAARKPPARLLSLLVSFSAPLTLRCVQEGRYSGEASDGTDAALGAYAASSVLAFFVVSYFFGRAMRHWTAGGYPSGRMIHEVSLFPTLPDSQAHPVQPCVRERLQGIDLPQSELQGLR